MTDTGSWVQDYSSTFSHWVLVGLGVLSASVGIYLLLRMLGAKPEAATGVALVTPWVLGFLIFTLFPFTSRASSMAVPSAPISPSGILIAP